MSYTVLFYHRLIRNAEARIAELKRAHDMLRGALERIARGPYVFEYEHERLEECQRIAANALAGRTEE